MSRIENPRSQNNCVTYLRLAAKHDQRSVVLVLILKIQVFALLYHASLYYIFKILLL